MKKNTHFKYAITLIIIILLLTISIFNPIKEFKLENHIKDNYFKLNKVLVSYFHKINRENTTNKTNKCLVEENLNASLKEEISDLKKLLELNSTLTDFNKINSTIISRNNQYWFNSIIIDKGKNSGIKKDMAVITENGLIGKISKTTKTTSEVKLLTSKDIRYKTSVIVKVEEKDYYAILNGSDKKNKYLKLLALDKNVKLKKGDKVYTSGLGKIPKGIFIGTVVKSEIDKYDLSQIVYIKPKQDFNDIKYVTILKENKN